MKIKHIILGILFVFTIKANSQTEVPVENWSLDYTNTYFKDINGHFNKFLGTWEYSSSDKYFKIQFYKINKVPASTAYYYTGNQFYDYICSFIEYKEKQNGEWVTVYSTFGTPAFTSTNFSSSTTRSKVIRGYALINSNNTLILRYTEPTETCRYTRSLKITYQLQGLGNPPKLFWERDLGINYVSSRPCDNVDESPFQIPANMVLTKV